MTVQKQANLTRDVWCVLGLPFDVVNLQDSVIKLTKSASTSERLFLTTPNLNFLITAQSDPEFFQSVVESDLSVADGMPLIWAAKLLGIPLTERVAGSTLFDELSEQGGCSEKIKVFFFGGQQGVAELAHQKLNEASPAMLSCGFYDPGFVSVEEMSSPEVINRINSVKPDFIVVALGAKKGQAWIQKNRSQLTASVISHLGAVINFVAGNVERAPVVWQRFGLEWVWRIRQEPALWRRYLFDGLIFSKLLLTKVMPLAVYDRILKRSLCFLAPYSIEIEQQSRSVIRIGGSISYAVLDLVKPALISVVDEQQGDVIMDCKNLEYIDGAFIATLLLFQAYLNERQRLFSLYNVPKRIMRILSLNCVLKRFVIMAAK